MDPKQGSQRLPSRVNLNVKGINPTYIKNRGKVKIYGDETRRLNQRSTRTTRKIRPKTSPEPRTYKLISQSEDIPVLTSKDDINIKYDDGNKIDKPASIEVPVAEGIVPSAEGIAPSAEGIMPVAEGIVPSAEGIAPSAEDISPDDIAVDLPNEEEKDDEVYIPPISDVNEALSQKQEKIEESLTNTYVTPSELSPEDIDITLDEENEELDKEDKEVPDKTNKTVKFSESPTEVYPAADINRRSRLPNYNYCPKPNKITENDFPCIIQNSVFRTMDEYLEYYNEIRKGKSPKNKMKHYAEIRKLLGRLNVSKPEDEIRPPEYVKMIGEKYKEPESTEEMQEENILTNITKTIAEKLGIEKEKAITIIDKVAENLEKTDNTLNDINVDAITEDVSKELNTEASSRLKDIVQSIIAKITSIIPDTGIVSESREQLDKSDSNIVSTLIPIKNSDILNILNRVNSELLKVSAPIVSAPAPEVPVPVPSSATVPVPVPAPVVPEIIIPSQKEIPLRKTDVLNILKKVGEKLVGSTEEEKSSVNNILDRINKTVKSSTSPVIPISMSDIQNLLTIVGFQIGKKEEGKEEGREEGREEGLEEGEEELREETPTSEYKSDLSSSVYSVLNALNKQLSRELPSSLPSPLPSPSIITPIQSKDIMDILNRINEQLSLQQPTIKKTVSVEIKDLYQSIAKTINLPTLDTSPTISNIKHLLQRVKDDPRIRSLIPNIQSVLSSVPNKLSKDHVLNTLKSIHNILSPKKPESTLFNKEIYNILKKVESDLQKKETLIKFEGTYSLPPTQVIEPNTIVLDVIKYKQLTEPNYGNNKISKMRDNVMIRAIKPPNSVLNTIRDVDEMFALLKLKSIDQSIQKTNDAGKNDNRYDHKILEVKYNK